MTEEIYDVVLLSTGNFQCSIKDFQDNPPPDKNLFLGPDFWIGHLPFGVSSNQVFDACDAPGFNFHPTRQYGMRYAFCRRVQSERESFYAWDNDLTLHITLFLSRLIRPTTIGLSLSSKLYFEDGKLATIVPGPTQGLGAHAWVIAKEDWRDWLSRAECEELRELLPRYQRSAPDRVRWARKYLDNAFHAFYLDQRVASLVTSFESLLQTSKYNLQKKFALRAQKLAELVGLELAQEDAEWIYGDRSAFVHGSPVSFSELDGALVEKYTRFERVIRLVLLRASTEPEFAAHFSSDEAVNVLFGV